MYNVSMYLLKIKTWNLKWVLTEMCLVSDNTACIFVKIMYNDLPDVIGP